MSHLRFAICAILLSALPVYSQPANVTPPPAILQIYRDQVKPSKIAEYSRVEGEAAQACARASTWPYLTIQSVTGPQEVWFMSGFDSYEAMERSTEPFARNTNLAAELNRLLEAKASLVSEPRALFAHYRDDLSSSGGLVKPRARFFTITVVTVRPGRERDYEEIHRALRAVREKAGATDNRVVYQVVSGMPKSIYLIFSAYHSLQDTGNALDPAVEEYATDVDEAARNRFDEFTRLSVLNSETWIFSVSPAMSNPAGEWIADDPEFWKSSPPLRSVAPKKPPEKPSR